MSRSLEFETKRKLGIFVVTRNRNEIAGNVRLFSERFPAFFTYHQLRPEYALERTWRFKILSVFHIGKGLATVPNGWSVSFPALKLSKSHNGWTLSFRWANYARFQEVSKRKIVRTEFERKMSRLGILRIFSE